MIAPSFADIFASNSHKNGLLPVALDESSVKYLADLAEHDPLAEVEIDLESQRVSAEGLETRFEIDPFVKDCLLKGLDEIDLTLAVEEKIRGFESHRPAFKPALP